MYCKKSVFEVLWSTMFSDYKVKVGKVHYHALFEVSSTLGTKVYLSSRISGETGSLLYFSFWKFETSPKKTFGSDLLPGDIHLAHHGKRSTASWYRQADIPCDSRAFGRKSTCCNAEEIWWDSKWELVVLEARILPTHTQYSSTFQYLLKN